MKKKLFALFLIAALMLCMMPAAFAADDEITLDVIICQYGPNTNEWFLGKGMDGSNFVEKFEAANPGIRRGVLERCLHRSRHAYCQQQRARHPEHRRFRQLRQ